MSTRDAGPAGPTGTTPARSRRGARALIRTRVRQGRARVRAAWFPVLQASVAAGVAWAVGYYVLGHPYPFFATVAAWICLGFSADRQIRRVAEVAVGVALGVALGDLVVHWIGSGPWQVAAVLFVAAMTARFLDRGQMVTMQAGVQAMVIVGLPMIGAAGGPVGRWTDALAGGLVALVVAALTPRDPRRRPRLLARDAVVELADMLMVLARGLRAKDVHDVEEALIQGRGSQGTLDDWSESAQNARDLARVSPPHRKHRAELAEMGRSAVLVDRAMRNARVLARRSLALLSADEPHELTPVADRVEDLSHAALTFAGELLTGVEPVGAREQLLAVAGELDPFTLAPEDWQTQSLVLLLRSLVVDLLEAVRVSPRDAREALPEL